MLKRNVTNVYHAGMLVPFLSELFCSTTFNRILVEVTNVQPATTEDHVLLAFLAMYCYKVLSGCADL